MVVRPDASGQRAGIGPEPDDKGIGQGGAHDGIEDDAGRCGQHRRRRAAENLQHGV